MTDPKHILISDFSYDLPDDRIARFPVERRDMSKLLVYKNGEIGEDRFRNLADYLEEGELMVFNNTKVIQARLMFTKPTGASIEIFLLEPYDPPGYEQIFQAKEKCSWICLIGNQKKWKEGTLQRELSIRSNRFTLNAEKNGTILLGNLVKLSWNMEGVSFADILDVAGILPIPPYLDRETVESDKTTYQTIYSKIKGSVAAPTAGLHFTEDVLADIDRKGIERKELTLHVGAGTFRPVKSEVIEDHPMHAEHFTVSLDVIDSLIRHKGKAVAVGTTSVRTLESLYYIGLKLLKNSDTSEDQLMVEQWEPYDSLPDSSRHDVLDSLEAIRSYMISNGLSSLSASTRIIIVPGYKYKIVRKLITNFHQPQSTLLLLVGAFVGDDWRRIYDYALTHSFRFLSYGDSSILIP